MQRFTGIEIGWIAHELDKRVREFRLEAHRAEHSDPAAVPFLTLRADQYESIALRLKQARENRDKRIEIL